MDGPVFELVGRAALAMKNTIVRNAPAMWDRIPLLSPSRTGAEAKRGGQSLFVRVGP